MQPMTSFAATSSGPTKMEPQRFRTESAYLLIRPLWLLAGRLARHRVALAPARATSSPAIPTKVFFLLVTAPAPLRCRETSSAPTSQEIRSYLTLALGCLSAPTMAQPLAEQPLPHVM